MQIEAKNSRLRPRPKALVSAILFLNVFQGCVFHNCNIFQVYGLRTHNQVCLTWYVSVVCRQPFSTRRVIYGMGGIVCSAVIGKVRVSVRR